MKTRCNSWLFCLVLGFGLCSALAAEPPDEDDRIISSLMEDEQRLNRISFSNVVKEATGKRVIPLAVTNVVDSALLQKINNAVGHVLQQLNATNHPAQRERRINEVSPHFESALREALNNVPGFRCDFPRTAANKTQRSGYPDLRLVDKESRRIIYIDPKLYERGSRASTLRTFYYEPKTDTNKILDDAHHLLVGIEHDGRPGRHWRFLTWQLVDLAHVRVRLKAEFQSSNRDLYRRETIVGQGQAEPKPIP